MHTEPYQLVTELHRQFPEYFTHKKVLEVGSLDINGTVRGFFTNCTYIGIDLGEGKGVDVVSPIHEYLHPNEFDVVVCTEMLEHDKFWRKSLRQMYHNLKSRGLLIFSCAGPTRQEHGTTSSTASDSPFTNDYYENRTKDDLLSEWKDQMFYTSFCYYLREGADLIFWGIKK